jgi:hypothetical protein
LPRLQQKINGHLGVLILHEQTGGGREQLLLFGGGESDRCSAAQELAKQRVIIVRVGCRALQREGIRSDQRIENFAGGRILSQFARHRHGNVFETSGLEQKVLDRGAQPVEDLGSQVIEYRLDRDLIHI